MSVEENAAAINSRFGGRLSVLIERRIPDLFLTGSSAPKKYFRLTEIVDEISKVIAPNAPCKKGCAHCCKMAVGISEHEAKLISEYTGQAALPVTEIRLPDENVRRYAGVPCSFLNDDGTCSIYDVRPLACRAHHVVEDTAEGCEINEANKERTVASLDLSEIHFAAARILIDHAFGDIRQFFPRR